MHVSRLSRGIRPNEPSHSELAFLAARELEDPLLARPEDPVILLTPVWSEAPSLDSRLDQAFKISRDSCGDLELHLCVELDDFVELRLPVQIGDYTQHRDGSVERFGMRRLGPGTWLLQPSLNIPGDIHVFVVMCEVPEPPPWEKSA